MPLYKCEICGDKYEFLNRFDTMQLCDKCYDAIQNKNNMVEHPKHYNMTKYEVIEVLDEWFPNDPLIWQVVKYLSRAKYKGNELEDLKKAQFYLNRKINKLENNNAK